MKSRKIVKMKLLISVLCLILCVSMWADSTFAWFTDSVTSHGNTIAAGTLKAALEYADAKADPDSANWNDASQGSIFHHQNWEPGYTDAYHIKISNIGTLSFQYSLTLVTENGDPPSSAIANAIDVYLVAPAAALTREMLTEKAILLGTLAEVMATVQTDGALEPGEVDTYTLVLKMKESAGNEVQDEAVGPFYVKLFATQLASESDSFGSDYDQNASRDETTAPPLMANDPFIHISFDDVTHCLRNLSSKQYSSLFEEPFFGWLKGLHNTYGAKFSLYTYNNVLQSVPATYASEFEAAKDWLKIGLHATSSSSTFTSSSYADGNNAWNTFVGYVKKITGTTDSIDRMPRLHYFAGSKNALKGMQAAECGALGFLAADDSRNSYYLNATVSANLYNNDHLTDLNNGLVFLNTDMRGDWFLSGFSSANQFRAPTFDSVYEELEYRFADESFKAGLESYIFFSHEWQFYSGTTLNAGKVWTEDACRFAADHGIEFAYPQEKAFSPTAFDLEKETVTEPETTTTTTRNGETVTIVTDQRELQFVVGSFSGGVNETPMGSASTGRAVTRYYVLKVNGGETLSLVQNIDGITLQYALKEFGDIPLTAANIIRSGETYLRWLSEDLTLQADTKYIILGFKNGDGSTNFTEEQLKMLPSCLSITD